MILRLLEENLFYGGIIFIGGERIKVVGLNSMMTELFLEKSIIVFSFDST